MSTISIGNKAIDKFFGFLCKMDTDSKKKLIIKLTESIEASNKPKRNLKSLFGSWIDNRNSDTIIKEIRESRINIHDISEF